MNPSPGPTGDSEAGKGASQKANDAETRTSDTETARPGPVPESGRPAAPSRSAIASRHAAERRQSADAGVSRDSREEVAPNRIAAEHSILVNAPEPGSPPFVVNLPGEAVSASGAIAISARRTLEILPRSPGSSGRAERVIIGKLISHSQPFYPVEARNRRMEGNVELRARVGRTGEIVGVTPVSGPRLPSARPRWPPGCANGVTSRHLLTGIRPRPLPILLSFFVCPSDRPPRPAHWDLKTSNVRDLPDKYW